MNDGIRRLGRVPAFDSLRAVAVILVLFTHLWAVFPFGPFDARWTKSGFLGVDLFFVLSGFLITSLLLEEHHDTGGIHAGRFYAREGAGDADSLHDILEGLFGGRGERVRVRARGADVAYTLPIEFLDAAKGAKKRVTVGDGRTIDLTIPAGVTDRQTLRLKGQGMPGFEGGPPGDAYVEVHIQPHAFFTRKDNNVHVDLPVGLSEAVLGGKVEVPTIDGPVSMSVPKGANTGTVLRLRGKGAPRSDKSHGDEYVTLKIVLPERPDPELEEFAQRWQAGKDQNPRRNLEA